MTYDVTAIMNIDLDQYRNILIRCSVSAYVAPLLFSNHVIYDASFEFILYQFIILVPCWLVLANLDPYIEGGKGGGSKSHNKNRQIPK